jgi:hypothetical protein
MPRVSMLLASFGLAFNVLLWSVPALVAASSVGQLVAPSAPNLAERLPGQGGTKSLLDALIGLMGAESEAMQVAGAAIQDPRAPHLAERADAAGGRVLDAVKTYIQTFERVTNHPLPRF